MTSMLDDAREGMDPSIRPQDDLFGHVNGRWLETAEIPDDRSSWGPFVALSDLCEQQVHAIVEELAQEAAERAGDVEPDLAKVGTLYATFMDEDHIESLGAGPLHPLLKRADELTEIGRLGEVLGRVERAGAAGVFGSYVDTDDRNSDRYIVNLTQGGLGLPDESYYRESKFAEIREKYVAYVARMFELAGAADPSAQAEAALRVETRLAEGHWERADTRDVLRTYNLHTADELAELCPSFDFAAFADALGGDRQTLAEVIVRQPSYFEHLHRALEEVPLDDWRSWLGIRIIRSAAPFLSSDFVETNFDFYGRTLAGTPQMRARWKRGISLVESALGEALGKAYVERHFPATAKQRMDELVDNLLAAYRHSIERLDWMSEATKQRAYEKLATFRPKIGHPEKFRDYSGLEVVPGDLVASVIAGNAFDTDYELRKIGSPVDRDEWFMLPQTVNAYYNPGTNEICFPAGILQRPFFDPEVEDAENYGGIGAVIGHEIGHGFDDQGAQYDAHGNLDDWWTPEDKERFGQLSAKLVEQYDAFEPRNLPGERVNGQLTVGENIGDLGGLTIAHLAYLISLDGAEPPVADDGSTGVQRLFLSWGHIWRTKRRRELDLQYLTIDPHSPPEFRANIVRNLDEFHEAFGSVEGDGLWLDPADRVRIW